MPLVPVAFAVPERFEHLEFVIRKLTVNDTALDYKAVMSSIGIIGRTRGGDWPTAALTLAEDRVDLAEHEREFEARIGFAYTVVSPDETECLGCVYFYPPGHRGAATAGADVDVSFWVTQAAYDNGLYPVLFDAIEGWLDAAWPFRKVAYSNVVLPGSPA